jgi:hypothetical protein
LIERRHLTKSQIAMLTAKVYPKGKQGERTDLSTSLPGKEVTAAVNATDLSMARTILSHLPALADSVAAGTASLKEAYRDALVEKERIDKEKADTERLRVGAPHWLEKERQEIAKLIKELRPETSQHEIAKAIGVDQKTISNDLRNDSSSKSRKGNKNSEDARKLSSTAGGAAVVSRCT